MYFRDGEKISVKENWASGDSVTAAQLNSLGDAINDHSTALGVSEAVPFTGVAFGGDGSDGALAITSGTTNINANQWYQYSSISITSTGKLSIASGGAGAAGTIFVKCSGNCTITSSGNSIDLVGKGAAGGSGVIDASGTSGTAGGLTGQTYGAGSGGATGGAAGVKATAALFNRYPPTQYGAAFFVLNYKADLATGFLGPGSGGGGGDGHGTTGGGGGGGGPSGYADSTAGANGGGADSGTGGNGGAGGGAIIMEVAGDLNFTGIINLSGAAGGNASGTRAGGGGGGGGGTGRIMVAGSITDSGTKTVAGGALGSPSGAGGNGGTGGNGILTIAATAVTLT